MSIQAKKGQKPTGKVKEIKAIGKGMQKVLDTVAKFEAKRKASEVLTVREMVSFANALYKLENKSASKLYKEAQGLSEANEVLNGAKFPTFEDFVKDLPLKHFYSFYDALNVLARLSPKAKQASKVAKQGGEIGAKAKAQTSVKASKMIGA